MSDADVPREQDAFGRAFEVDGADAGAALDVFDGDEACLCAPVCAVEGDARTLVVWIESGGVHLVVERLREHVVGFRVGVEEVFDVPFFAGFFRGASEDGAGDFEGVACAE